ncbi:MAG: TlpA disulfide reductase family protein [Bacteroidales bacterium]|jgi:cytochrome c biogenesis protein CcmG/thiol:disulfide interchange protein DsbE|nr:TlpA disulfide reductase family protein [Bacteroidales bacterium]
MLNKTTLVFLLIIGLSGSILKAQNSNQSAEKQIYAKNFIGKKAPDLNIKGWIIEPPETAGKFLLVDLWATWCGPCRRGIPELNEWHRKYTDKLVIIGLSDENEEKILSMKSPIIEYPNGYDTDGYLKKQLEVRGIPHVLVINPDGVIVWQGFPKLVGFELTPEVLEALIGWN